MIPRFSSTFWKYMAVQVPGWLLLVMVLLALRSWLSLPAWAAVMVVALAVVKDLVLYRFLKHAYEGDPRGGAERLVGHRGSVARALTPHGFVFVRGELWQARVEGATGTVPEGTIVRVRGGSRLVLEVEPETEDGSHPPGTHM